MPPHRVFVNISQMLLIILTVADNMIIGTVLPYIYAVFLITKSFERRNEPRRNGVLHCRDRRPRRSVIYAFYPQHNMNMVWHNYVTLDRKIVVKIVQLIIYQRFVRMLSLRFVDRRGRRSLQYEKEYSVFLSCIS